MLPIRNYLKLWNVFGRQQLHRNLISAAVSSYKPILMMKPKETKFLSFNQTFRNLSSESKPVEKNEPEKLFREIDIYLKSHENSVLKSYTEFCVLAANELEIKVNKVLHPKAIYDRLTFLKSAHVHKKHRVQYEMRTYKRVIQLKYLTNSTANVYLEYIQRNIPAGVAMHVHKWEIQRIPDHIKEQIKKNMNQLNDEDWEREAEEMMKMKISRDMTEADFEEYITTKPHLLGTVF